MLALKQYGMIVAYR